MKLIAPDGDTRFTTSKSTNAASALTARFAVTGLSPGSRYHYQVGTTAADGIETWTGDYAFDTVPADPDRLDVAVLSDFANWLVSSPALRTAIQSRPDLLAIIGDLDHRSPADAPDGTLRSIQDAPAALVDMRRMHQDTRDPSTPIGADFFSGIVGDPDTGRPQIPMVYAWDDHDFCANNMDRTCPFARESFQAYDEYYILAPDNWQGNRCKAEADFEGLAYGTLVQLFFLDARSNRTNANPDGGSAMLGPCQHQWLVDRLHAATTLWKIILSPVPINATAKPWDAWSLFPSEREALLASIADVPNVVFVSGDLHSGGAVDDGTHSGRPEVSTPHANMPTSHVNTFCLLEGGVLVSRPGSWTIGGVIEPILGVEPLQCDARTFPDGFPTNGLSAPVYPLDGRDNAGYTWITATRTWLELSVHGVDGRTRLGVDADGAEAPLSLTLGRRAP